MQFTLGEVVHRPFDAAVGVAFRTVVLTQIDGHRLPPDSNADRQEGVTGFVIRGNFEQPSDSGWMAFKAPDMEPFLPSL